VARPVVRSSGSSGGSKGVPAVTGPLRGTSARSAPGAGAGLAGWPEELLPVFTQAVTAECTSLTRGGAPIMVPLTPFAEDGAGSLDVSTGLAFPAKAERARRNPKVCLLYADPVGSGLADPPVVLVQGLATVRDADLQANTDRYVRSVLAKTPDAFKGIPKFLLRRLDWYFARIWIQVTPTRMWWWGSKSLDAEPGEWADSTPVAPSSDPVPPGKQPPAWLEAPADWRAAARASAGRLGHPDLSWVGPDGFPLAVPVRAEQIGQGFRLRFGRCLPGVPQGRACLTFHSHPARFTGQENHSFVGDVSAAGLDGVFCVDRLLADVSLTGNRLTAALGFLGKGRRLAPRLQAEAARRGQPVPRIRLPRPY
jgi:hypothetical protein